MTLTAIEIICTVAGMFGLGVGLGIAMTRWAKGERFAVRRAQIERLRLRERRRLHKKDAFHAYPWISNYKGRLRGKLTDPEWGGASKLKMKLSGDENPPDVTTTK